MQTVNVDTWEEFEDALKAHNISTSGGHLFRGQSRASWLLQTTLERRIQRPMHFADYYRLIGDIQPEVETFTDTNWPLIDYPEMAESSRKYEFSHTLASIGETFRAYSYMIYLRHHGFPSPLLDWSRTPYVAAHFAFSNSGAERVAIYVYTEYEHPGAFKVRSTGPQIFTLGPYVQTHRRHFLQQSTYTICLDFQTDRGWNFVSHENVFRRDDGQDFLYKFTIPSEERVKVLKILDSYNLNTFSLFDSTEALMETLAVRYIDFRPSPEG